MLIRFAWPSNKDDHVDSNGASAKNAEMFSMESWIMSTLSLHTQPNMLQINEPFAAFSVTPKLVTRHGINTQATGCKPYFCYFPANCTGGISIPSAWGTVSKKCLREYTSQGITAPLEFFNMVEAFINIDKLNGE